MAIPGSFWRFHGRRVRRLLPALVVNIAVVSVLFSLFVSLLDDLCPDHAHLVIGDGGTVLPVLAGDPAALWPGGLRRKQTPGPAQDVCLELLVASLLL